MATIKITGVIDLFQVSDEEAKKLASNLENLKPDSVIRIGGLVTKKSQIQGIFFESQRNDDNEKIQIEINSWIEKRHEIISSSLEKRVELATKFFKLLFWAFTDQEPDNQQISKSQNISQDFLKNNNRLYPDFELWKEIIKLNQKQKHFTSQWHQKAYELCEKSLAKDIDDQKLESLKN